MIDPAAQPDKTRAFFGATVTLADEDDNEKVVTLVGDDEQDASAGRIGWSSPLARALKGRSDRGFTQRAASRRAEGMGSNGNCLCVGSPPCS